MKTLVQGRISNEKGTISEVMIDGKHQCFALEDPYRPEKIKHETRIPNGIYDIGLRKEGRHYRKYTKRWKWHKETLHILNVPNYKFIMIHVGNTTEHTSGCLLLGSEFNQKNMTISESVKAYKNFYEKVYDAAKAGELQIEFARQKPKKTRTGRHKTRLRML